MFRTLLNSQTEVSQHSQSFTLVQICQYTLPDLHSPKEVQAQLEVKLSGMEGQGTDKEQQRQYGLVAPDVERPPTVEETNTEVSNRPDHKENNTGGSTGPTTALRKRS